MAKQFNPSVMSPVWLDKHGLVPESEVEPAFVFSDALVQVRTKKFALLVVPEQFQLLPLVDATEEQSLIIEKVGTLVEYLPHTPFTAVGMNFTYHIIPEGESITALSRRLFFRESSALDRCFNQEDAQFGGYYSKNILNCRLKLDIKPVAISETGEPRMQFAFNYHRDVAGAENPVALIRSQLELWDKARAEADRITTLFLPEK